ncbi:MAG: GIY-YIG nuclease family protein [Calditrichaeota bacterium]|nr:MAG: GIY-YIG nuclease family protein [Calditrichota bacterium]
MEACYLYILYSPSLDRYYVGTSHKPHLRLKYHNSSPRGYTRGGRPWKLVYVKEFASRAVAQKWERWLKQQKNRHLIERMLRGEFNWGE